MFEQLKSMLQGRGNVTALSNGISNPQMRSILLSRRADELLRSGRLREAVAALKESKKCYRDVRANLPKPDLLIADVQACRVLAQHARSHGISAVWNLVQAGNDPVQITVASSLAVAAQELGFDRVPDTLDTTPTRPAIDVALLSPPDRRSPEQADDDALQLAEISLALWQTRRTKALRLGIEAHYLFAIAS